MKPCRCRRALCEAVVSGFRCPECNWHRLSAVMGTWAIAMDMPNSEYWKYTPRGTLIVLDEVAL